jgi:uncharacterized protein (UPF0332 family)
MKGHPPFESRDSVGRVEKSEWLGYYRSAKEFMETAQGALRKGNYNAAANNAIHAAINACNAALIYNYGVCSQGRHYNTPDLFGQYFTSPGGASTNKKLILLIGREAEVEYEAKFPSPQIAENMVDMAQEILGFVARKLPI